MSNIDPVLLVRSISEAQAKIILALLFQRGGMTIEELERRTGIGRKALYRACDDLAGAPFNMLVKQTGQRGRLFWSASSALLPMIADAYFQLPGEASGPRSLEILPSDDFQLGPEAPGQTQEEPIFEENDVIFAPGEASGPRSKGSIRLMIDDSNNLNINQSSINPRENFPTCTKLLEAMISLFGDNLDATEIPADTPPKLLMAWIVKAYGDRTRITSPLGLIRARLRAKSPRSLPRDWQDRLPGDFLREIGIDPPPQLFSDDADPVTASVEKWLGRSLDV